MKRKLSFIVAVATLFATALIGKAAPGDLDPTFGNGGIVVTEGSSFNHLNTANGIAIQADGKIVAVGEGATSSTWDFAVVRYNTDGSLDTSFGGSGIVLTPVGESHDQAFSVAIQADGKIVVVGVICNGVGNCSGASSLAIVRYNPNGSLDTSFNGTGKVINSTSDGGWDLAIQADGKIVAVGDDFGFRYNTDGSPDSSFGGTGRISLGIDVDSVAIQADGKIVSAGRLQNSFAIARNNTDGSPDTTFNGTGQVITVVGGSGSQANELAIQSDGKIVAVGEAGNSVLDSDFALVRYNPNGSLDTAFGGTGKIIIPIGNFGDEGYSVAIQSDGKINVAGHTYYGSKNVVTHSDFAVARLNQNGSLDTTFNGTGIVITSVPGNWDGARSAAVQSDGKIVVAGSSDPVLFDFYDFVVVRYQIGPSISGTVTYGNSIGSPALRNVSNVLMSGSGSIQVSALTGFPGGNYTLSGFGSGAYTVTPSKTGGVNGAISSFDAATVAMYAAGTITLSPAQLIVADVSGNGTISSFDAGQIARYASSVPGSGLSGSWIFTPANRSYTSVTSNVTGENFIALLMGEVSGNWTNTGARPR